LVSWLGKRVDARGYGMGMRTYVASISGGGSMNSRMKVLANNSKGPAMLFAASNCAMLTLALAMVEYGYF